MEIEIFIVFWFDEIDAKWLLLEATVFIPHVAYVEKCLLEVQQVYGTM